MGSLGEWVELSSSDVYSQWTFYFNGKAVSWEDIDIVCEVEEDNKPEYKLGFFE